MSGKLPETPPPAKSSATPADSERGTGASAPPRSGGLRPGDLPREGDDSSGNGEERLGASPERDPEPDLARDPDREADRKRERDHGPDRKVAGEIDAGSHEAGHAPAKPATTPRSAMDLPAHPGVPLAPPGIVPESDVRTHSPGAAQPHREHGVVEELGELPAGYGDGRLVCLVRDPATVFVYWDLSQQQIEQFFSGLGSARGALRLFNGRQAGDLVREVEVHLDARGWYVRELPSALEVRVELWAIGERGARMLRAARPVRLPPSSPSNVLEELYAALPLGEPLPRDGQVIGGRPLTVQAGAMPPGWERRVQARWRGATSSRFASSSGQFLDETGETGDGGDKGGKGGGR